ncbi:MAG: ABC transporter substrate-binding protein [Burkholderiales bacterium]|nr:ABC transporter substrate-binding protein [Burkholderiales bacterium]
MTCPLHRAAARGAVRMFPSRGRWRRLAEATLLAALVASPIARAGVVPIRIGLIAPLTGASADFGTSVRQGAELAVDEINAAGGVLGRPLALVVKDDRGDPASGLAAAAALVTDDRVVATIGFCNTGVAMKALDLFESHHQLLIVPCAQGTAITRRARSEDSMVFRVAPVDALNAAFLAGEIVDRRRLSRVAILADTTGYGDGGVADVGAQLARRGLQPAYVGRFAADAPSLAEQLQAARSAGAQALVVYTVGPGEAVAVKGRAAMHWDVPYFGPWTLSFRSVLDAAGAGPLEGTMMTQSIIQDSANEARTAFIAAFARRYAHRPPGSLMAAAQTYDSVNLLVRALFATHGDTSPAAVRQSLEQPREPHRGVVTTYDHPFSRRDHDAFSVNMIWLGVWRGGEIHYFHAADAGLSGAVRHKQEPGGRGPD